jgi:5-methylcytosine-specific restriction protein B
MREDIKEILTNFFEQVENDNQTTSNFPSLYAGLEMKVGFGYGRTAKIPWITFLGKDQSPQNGIFPVYYFFKDYNKLILAYGISETEKPNEMWLVSPRIETISDYFKEEGKEPHKYGLSYVYEVYDTNKDLDWKKIETDLQNLIAYYKLIMQTK